MDSRLRGNDGLNASTVIPAEACPRESGERGAGTMPSTTPELRQQPSIPAQAGMMPLTWPWLRQHPSFPRKRESMNLERSWHVNSLTEHECAAPPSFDRGWSSIPPVTIRTTFAAHPITLAVPLLAVRSSWQRAGLVFCPAKGDVDMFGGPFRRTFRCRRAGFSLTEAPPASRTATPHRSTASVRDKKWSCGSARLRGHECSEDAPSRRSGAHSAPHKFKPSLCP